MSQGYRSMSDWLQEKTGLKVRKIAVNAGLGCPNRDGRIGKGGCIYCNNRAFNPRYAFKADADIAAQIARGIEFSSHKGAAQGYLAYFQSYTNTYSGTAHLIDLYSQALSCPGIVGLVIATRPDCLAPDLLDWMQTTFVGPGKPFLLVELGIESTIDRTLQLINRGHDWVTARSAVLELAGRGINVGGHIILGLPGESRSDMLSHASALAELPLSTLKLHQLQVVRDTPLAQMYMENPDSIHLFTAREYARLVLDFIQLLPPEIALDRFVSETPPSLLLAPKWGLKPSQFQQLLGEIRS